MVLTRLNLYLSFFSTIQLNPAGGAGAMSAIHDAVCLANWINVLPTLAMQDLEATFKEYYDERYPQVMTSYRTSMMFAKGLKRNATGAIIRYINSHMPKWLWRLILKKGAANRPQVSFLDPAKDTIAVPPSDQPSLIKTKIILKMLAKKQQQKVSPALSTTTIDPVAV